MARSDQKVISPNPGFLFLWFFFLVTGIFLSVHHWSYSNNKKLLPFQKQRRLQEDLPTKIRVTQQRGKSGLVRLTGAEVLADQVPDDT